MNETVQKPRVAVVVQLFPDRTPFLLYKFQRLVERGWPVEMICLDRKREAGDALIRLSDQAARRLRYAWPTTSSAAALALLPLVFLECLARNPAGTLRYLRRGFARFGADVVRHFYLDASFIAARPDVVHFEFGPLAVGRMHLRESLGCAVVVSFRGYDLNYVGLEDHRYYDDVWNQADAFHFLGEDLWNRARTRGCPPDKTPAFIPPAVDTDFFSFEGVRTDGAIGTEDRPLRLLSVGRLVAKKGHEYTLQAAALLEKRGIRTELRIVGDGDRFESLAFARHQLGLDDRVELLGAQPPLQVGTHMEWADVFVHSAVSEGFCNAVVEAQAMGLPSVCTDADGLRENIVDGKTGFVVPRRNPQEMADAVARLAHDGNLRKQMGQAARRRAVECFSLERQIDAFEALYASVVDQASGAPHRAIPATANATDAR